MMQHNLSVAKTIKALLDEKKYQSTKDILLTMNPADIAAIFEELAEERIPLLFRLLPKEAAAETFAELDPRLQELMIRGLSDTELREIVNELYVDDAADLVGADAVLEHAALQKRDVPAGDGGKEGRDGHDPQTAQLDQDQNHRLTEHGPVGRRIPDDQTGHTNGGGGGEKRVLRRSPDPLLRGDRQHQKHRPDQDDTEKTQNDDLIGR